MKKAEYNNKESIVDILTKSFEAYQSVNYIVKQDKKRVKRIKSLKGTGAFLAGTTMNNPLPAFIVTFGVWLLFL